MRRPSRWPTRFIRVYEEQQAAVAVQGLARVRDDFAAILQRGGRGGHRSRAHASSSCVVVLAVGAALLVLGGRDGAAPGAGDGRRVVRVVDGDTVRVRLAAVRYIGIDTPKAARAAAAKLYAGQGDARQRAVAGRRVGSSSTSSAAPLRRLLGLVYRAADDRFVNGALVRGGYARTLTIEPNVRFAARFAALAAGARRDGRGLWSACAASRPVAMRMRQSLSHLERAFVRGGAGGPRAA